MIARENPSCSVHEWHRVLRLAHRYPKQMNEALLLVDGVRTRDPDHPRLSIHTLRGDPQFRRGRRVQREHLVAERV